MRTEIEIGRNRNRISKNENRLLRICSQDLNKSGKKRKIFKKKKNIWVLVAEVSIIVVALAICLLSIWKVYSVTATKNAHDLVEYSKIIEESEKGVKYPYF